MPAVKSLEDLHQLREEVLKKRQAKPATGHARIIVSMGICGIAVGAREAMKAILETIEAENLNGIVVTQAGCVGLCGWEPIVQVMVGDEPKVTYMKVSPERAKRIVQEHVVGGKVIPEFVIPR